MLNVHLISVLMYGSLHVWTDVLYNLSANWKWASRDAVLKLTQLWFSRNSPGWGEHPEHERYSDSNK